VKEKYKMNLEQNKGIIHDFLIEIDRGSDAVDRFFSPNCMVHLPGSLSPTDREGFKAFIGMLYKAFPDLRHTLVDQIAENGKVANLVIAHGTHKGVFQGIPPTGKPVAITDIIIVKIIEGRVIELWAQFDFLGLLQQLGVSL
jgi:predicted ester cyclase